VRRRTQAENNFVPANSVRIRVSGHAHWTGQSHLQEITRTVPRLAIGAGWRNRSNMRERPRGSNAAEGECQCAAISCRWPTPTDRPLQTGCDRSSRHDLLAPSTQCRRSRFRIAGPKTAAEQCKDKAPIRQRRLTETAAGAVRIGAPRRSARPGSRREGALGLLRSHHAHGHAEPLDAVGEVEVQPPGATPSPPASYADAPPKIGWHCQSRISMVRLPSA
jgi:hypothetical protein